MRILIILGSLSGGGAERATLDLAHEFKRQGHNVEFLLMQEKGRFLKEAERQFNIINMNIIRFRFLPFALGRYLKSQNPDIVLAIMWPLTVIVPIIARLNNINCKVIVSEHGMLKTEYQSWGNLHRFFLRLSTTVGYRFADYRVGVSIGMIEEISNLSLMKTKYFNMIPNPIPQKVNKNDSKYERKKFLWEDTKRKRILTVGRLKAVKNHELLLKAFAKLESKDVCLMIVGEGPEENNILSLARNLGIFDRLIMPGFIEDLDPFYASTDIFVLSSDMEGFGNVIVEALAFGKPVVSTDCPSGPKEILQDGKYGKLVPMNNIEALTSAIEFTLLNKEENKKLKCRAKDFLPEHVAQKYTKLFEE
jgi:glycosyltransferase involved in cell wall biosynthesis